MYKEMFGKKLAKARERAGYTQEQIEKELKIKRSTLANYETGRNEPDLETIGTLADFYAVSVDWLLGTAGEKNYNDNKSAI